jgi:hypothetical protein
MTLRQLYQIGLKHCGLRRHEPSTPTLSAVASKPGVVMGSGSIANFEPAIRVRKRWRQRESIALLQRPEVLIPVEASTSDQYSGVFVL